MKHSLVHSSALGSHSPVVLLAQRCYTATLYHCPPLVDNLALFCEDKWETAVCPVIWLGDLNPIKMCKDLQQMSQTQGKQQVIWHSAGKQAGFMDVISPMVWVSLPTSSSYNTPSWPGSWAVQPVEMNLYHCMWLRIRRVCGDCRTMVLTHLSVSLSSPSLTQFHFLSHTVHRWTHKQTQA